MTNNPLLFFPPEIWRMVLGVLPDTFDTLENLTWLWVSRRVSKCSLEVIEYIFRTKHVPNTKLRFHIAVPKIQYQATERFRFYGIAGNTSRALFQNEPGVVKLPEGVRTEVPFGEPFFRGLRELQPQDSLLFTTDVFSAVNDTGLLDLQIDLERQEISCSWVGMLVPLFGEQRAAHKAEEDCPSDAFKGEILTPHGEAWAETILGYMPHYHLNKKDIFQRIARHRRPQYQRKAETGIVIPKDTITEDKGLIQERHQQTNYPSDGSDTNTEHENTSKGSEVRNQMSTDSGGSSSFPRMQPPSPQIQSAEAVSHQPQNLTHSTVDHAGGPDPQFRGNTTEDSPNHARLLVQCEAKREEVTTFSVDEDHIRMSQEMTEIEGTGVLAGKVQVKRLQGEHSDKHHDAAESLILLADKPRLRKNRGGGASMAVMIR